MKRTILALAALAVGLACCTASVPGMKKKAVPLPAAPAVPERQARYDSGGWIIARGSIHNHTIYSDGVRTPEDLFELARRQGMAILSYNDHREGKYCVGALCVSAGGIESVGYDKYWEHLDRVRASAAGQGMLVIKGIEVVPYMYQYGTAPNLVLDGLQHHFVIYGIDDLEVFRNMPTRNQISMKAETPPGPEPWEKFTRYLESRGALVFVPHVDEGRDMWIGNLHGACPPVPWNLALPGITGFAVLPFASSDRTAGPGGIWDSVLAEYMVGLRDKPLWSCGDADYHGPGSLAIATTLFYLKEFTEKEVLAAMKEGRMVSLQGNAFQNTFVAEWSVSEGKALAADPLMSGRTVKLSYAPVVRFGLDHPVNNVRVRLIRNGALVKEQAGSYLEFTDEAAGQAREPVYYRVEVVGPKEPYGKWDDRPTMPESEIFTNPIFVEFN